MPAEVLLPAVSYPEEARLGAAALHR